MRWRSISIALCLMGLAIVSRFLLAQAPAAPISDVQVAATATQAVIQYTTSYPGACSITAAEGGAAGGPTLPDVDPNLFPEADSDARFAEWRVEARRVFVLGRRTSEPSKDRLISRALAADSPHWFRLTCGTATHDGVFKTRTIGNGNIYPEAAPFDRTGFGNYAWPTIDWTDKTKSYVDPLTGVKIRMLSTPGAYGGTGTDKPFLTAHVLAGSWTTPAGILSSTPNMGATYSGPGNEAIYLPIDPEVFGCPYCNAYGIGGFQPTTVIDDLAAHVYGSASGSGVDGDVAICLSKDSGQSCEDPPQIVRLPQGRTEGDRGLVPTAFPKAEFAGWGPNAAIRKREMPQWGTASIAGTTLTVTSDTHKSYLTEFIPANSLIQIPGSSCPNQLCTLASVTNALAGQLQQSLTLNSSFKLAHVGIRLWKVTGTGTIKVRARMAYAYSLQPSIVPTGASDMCSRATVSVGFAADGVTAIPPKVGRLCSLTGHGSTGGAHLYLIFEDGSEAPRLLSLGIPQSAGSPVGDRPAAGAYGTWDFDWTNGLAGYKTHVTNAGSYALFKIAYSPDQCHWKTYTIGYRGSEGGELPSDPWDCFTWTNLTPASTRRDIDTQIRTTFPDYNPALFGAWGTGSGGGVAGNYFFISRLIGGQDTPCYEAAIDLATGLIVRGWRTWDGDESSRRRWAGCHASYPATIPGYTLQAYKYLYENPQLIFGGHYTFQITGVQNANLTWRTNTAISGTINDGSYNAVCPADLPAMYKTRGGAGTNCATIRINSLTPCRDSTFAQEKTAFPCPWDANKATLLGQQIIRGDTFGDQVSSSSERFQIAKVTAGPPIELVLIRRNGSQAYGLFNEANCGDIEPQRVHLDQWRPFMGLKDNVCANTTMWLNAVDGSDLEEDAQLTKNHHDIGAPATGTPGEVTIVGYSQQGYSIRTGPAAKIGRVADFSVTRNAAFAKGVQFVDAMQSYGSKRQWSATGNEAKWALDFKHLNGAAGSDWEVPAQMGSGKITRTLQSGTTKVYKFLTAQNEGGAPHNPKLSDALAFAGFHTMKDKSSAATGNVLTDGDDWHYCVAYRMNECRTGSAVGDIYMVVPHSFHTGAAAGYCLTNQYPKQVSCFGSGSPLAAWVIQFDVSAADATPGRGIRKLTMALSGPGRQYVYNNARATPSGRHILFKGDWTSGERTEWFIMNAPTFTTDPVNIIDRTTFIPVEVRVPAGLANRVVVKFGYAEYGAPSQFYGTTRQEPTVAVSPTINTAAPFLFAHEVTGTSGLACTIGCQLVIPAISGRVLFYELYSNNGGTLTAIPGWRKVVAVEDQRGS